MQLELSPQEHKLLLDLLESDLNRLNWDSARTHRAAFRAELKVREELLEGLLTKLKSLAMPIGAF